jgi:hypothetical protein
MIAMTSTAFFLVNATTGISVCGYDGTTLSSPRIENMSCYYFKEGHMSATSGTLAIIDNSDSKVCSPSFLL